METVIATRTYHRLDGVPVEVRLYQPIQIGETGYSCKVEVQAAGVVNRFVAFGGDSMQALVSVLILAPDMVRAVGVTRWLEGWEGLGLPESDNTTELAKG